MSTATATATTTTTPATRSAPSHPSAEPTEGELYRMSLEQYHRIADEGILGPKDRVVLIDGLLVSKMTRGPEHSSSATKGFRLLTRRLPEGWHARKEDSITLPDGPEGHPSEPEPDLMVVRGDDSAYSTRHPGPGEIALVIEVARSSLRCDRAMLARDAWARIPTVWIVNLVSRSVEVDSEPTGPGEDPRDRTVATLVEDGRLPVILDGTERAEVLVRDLIP